MPTYMVQASYTNVAWNKLVHRPENRMEALKPVVEKLGGRVLAWYYTFGDYDVLVLFDVPSNVNAAAFGLLSIRSNCVRSVSASCNFPFSASVRSSSSGIELHRK